MLLGQYEYSPFGNEAYFLASGWEAQLSLREWKAILQWKAGVQLWSFPLLQESSSPWEQIPKGSEGLEWEANKYPGLWPLCDSEEDSVSTQSV